MSFDPKKPKKLTIFAATAWPAWQEQYIELVRKEFEATGLKDDKELLGQVKKMGDAKKAMPFVQGLKRSLNQGESAEKVFDRKLPFVELDVLGEMVNGIKRTSGCQAVEIVRVEEGGKAGTVIVGESEGEEGKRRENLPALAEGATPGSPNFLFENTQT